jgi:hypothetical protein
MGERSRDRVENLDNISLFKFLISGETRSLTPSEKLVAIAIAIHRNNISFKCCPSLGRLAKITGLSRRAVIRATKALQQKKIMVRLRVMNGKRYQYNQYYFLFDLNDAIEIYENDDSILNKDKFEEVENFEWCIENKLFPNSEG